MKKIKDLILKENAIFNLALGLCTSLAMSNKVENAIIMGFLVFIILLISNVIISLFRKLIPDNVKIPVYILIIGTIVTISEILVQNYIPVFYKAVGIYLPLIVVNCIILGRALSHASKNTVFSTIKDSFKIGIGYIIAIVMIALVREILGAGTLTLMDSTSALTGFRMVYQVLPKGFNLVFFQSPAGAFIALGLLLAFLKTKKEEVDANN